MTQEDKELLLKDISGRLPYCPIVQISLFRNDGRKTDIDLDPHVTENFWELIDKYHAIPYLRPMSSMTEKEVKEFYDVECIDAKIGYIKPTWNWHFTINGIDWLNAHHFDYRELIEKGLAIEVTEENNPYEN